MAASAPAQDRPLRELRSVVERITFQNAENGFTVARLAPERPESEAEAARGDDRLVTVVGTLADLTPGEAIVATGWWRNDAKHGRHLPVAWQCGLPAAIQATSSGPARPPMRPADHGVAGLCRFDAYRSRSAASSISRRVRSGSQATPPIEART